MLWTCPWLRLTILSFVWVFLFWCCGWASTWQCWLKQMTADKLSGSEPGAHVHLFPTPFLRLMTQREVWCCLAELARRCCTRSTHFLNRGPRVKQSASERTSRVSYRLPPLTTPPLHFTVSWQCRLDLIHSVLTARKFGEKQFIKPLFYLFQRHLRLAMKPCNFPRYACFKKG